VKVYDVIICGAGPVGLFLACELALAKCSVLILEKTDNPYSPLKKLPFGIRGLSAPTIEALYRRGLLQELEIHKRLKNPHKTSAPVQGSRRQGGHFAGIPFLDGNIDTSQWKYRLPSSTDTNLISEIEELETVLSRRASDLGVETKRGHAVTDFRQTEDGVVCQSGDHSFQSKWLVGCDGARSTVRKRGGFEFAGTDPEFTGYSTLLDIADPSMLSPGRNVTAKGMYMQSQPGYVLMQDFDGGAFHHSDKPLTLEHVQEVLLRISGTDVTINALHVGTTWTDRARQATTYRNGRVILAGDAAHIHSPLGGQGLNLGLGDAMNLGWKLAATIQSIAPESLLDSYQTERHPLGVQVLDWSRAQVAVMKPGPAARALNAVIRALMNTRDGATYVAGRVWGISAHYNLAEDLPGAHSLLGYSVPNFEFEDGTRIGEFMHDGLGILLDFGGSASSKALGKTLVSEYRDKIKYIYGRAKEQFGLSTLLIRPDGITAWASDGEPNEELIRQAVALWFVR
jgi:2-polyprenyl-6-methoxyphenol hydroxylase-like FAD-dependent oxidoreductase